MRGKWVLPIVVGRLKSNAIEGMLAPFLDLGAR